MLCEYIGEHTTGGYNYGYEVTCHKIKNKPTKIPPRFKPSKYDKLKILETKVISRLTLIEVEEIRRDK